MRKKVLIIDTILLILSLLLYFFNLQEVIDTWFYQHIIYHDTLTSFLKGITHFGDPLLIVTAIVIISFYFLKTNKKKDALLLVGVSTLSFIVMITLKSLFQRERPNILSIIEITGFSFPSGHAYFSAFLYGYLIYLIRKEKPKHKNIYIGVLMFFILLIGFSRIYLGVHYLTDIIFGYTLGVASLILLLELKDYNKKQQNS